MSRITLSKASDKLVAALGKKDWGYVETML